MIRFYRSRLFWYWIPGFVFLLWGWWDSGGNYLFAELEQSSGRDIKAEISRGLIEVDVLNREDILPMDLFSWHYWHLTEEDPARAPGKPRVQRLDFPPAWEVERQIVDINRGGLSAEDGWVPSPGCKLPEPEFKLEQFNIKVAIWGLLLVYCTVATLSILC